jgi:ribonuclease HI
MEKVFVYVDGRAQGDPGEAAIGIAITDKSGNVIEEIARLIGRATSQVAQYRALMEGCRLALGYSPQLAIFFTNNQDLANHVNGVFETRQPHLRYLIEATKSLLNQFPQWRVNFIDQAAHSRAPRLVDLAFHNHRQVQKTHERLESRLLAEASSLSDEKMERLIEYAKNLKESS